MEAGIRRRHACLAAKTLASSGQKGDWGANFLPFGLAYGKPTRRFGFRLRMKSAVCPIQSNQSAGARAVRNVPARRWCRWQHSGFRGFGPFSENVSGPVPGASFADRGRCAQYCTRLRTDDGARADFLGCVNRGEIRGRPAGAFRIRNLVKRIECAQRSR